MGVLDRIKNFKFRGGRPSPPSPTKYEFEIVVLKPGVNIHSVHINETMEHEYEGFNIKAENLFKVAPGILDRIRYLIKGIDSKFIVIFQDDADNPISYSQPTYSARVLKTVSESRALSQALKDEFAKDMNVKTLFMYFLLIVGAGVVFLFVTGQINLGG